MIFLGPYWNCRTPKKSNRFLDIEEKASYELLVNNLPLRPDSTLAVTQSVLKIHVLNAKKMIGFFTELFNLV